MTRDKYGPESLIKVDGDEFPDIVTNVLVDYYGDRKLYTAYGERAGINLVEDSYADPDTTVVQVRVVDYTNLSMSGIAGLMPRDEF